jgi:hypothetical protein
VGFGTQVLVNHRFKKSKAQSDEPALQANSSSAFAVLCRRT